jgi:PhzF family phenazine biosynthesis protein
MVRSLHRFAGRPADYRCGRPHRLRYSATELGHETAFVLEPREGGDLRLRYFVPRHEMEICVYATVATVSYSRETVARSASSRHR